MHYLYSVLENLGVGLIAGLGICWFLAHQRAMRLQWQLARLSRVIRASYEDDIVKVFEPLHEKQERWRSSLEEIVQDVDRGTDRFVRLNAKTSYMLKTLFGGLEDVNAPAILELLGYSPAEGEKKVTYEDVAIWIDEFRDSIGVRCFFEITSQKTTSDIGQSGNN